MSNAAGFTVSLDEAARPLVLGIDVGSTGSRAGLYDARGVPVTGLRHKERHAFTTAGDGTATIDADQVAAEVARCLDEITHTLPPVPSPESASTPSPPLSSPPPPPAKH